MKKSILFFASLLLVLGMAASAMAFTTYGNNFTINNPSGGIAGGTNDVVFTWDGSVHPTLTGVSNATITSNEPLLGWLWYAHDVEVVGPGTHRVDICAKGPASCPGIGQPAGLYYYEVTVPAGMVGVHMLFDWHANTGDFAFAPSYCCFMACDADIWLVWDANKVYAGQLLYTGADNGIVGGNTPADGPTACVPIVPASVLDGYQNTAATVWDLVSVDAAGRITDATGTVTYVTYPLDGIPGMPFGDGAFPSYNANFNVMVCAEGEDCGCRSLNCNDNNACTIEYCDQATVSCVYTPRDCNDNNSCTIDSCDPATGCIHTPVPNGTSCDDGLYCNGNDTCSGGSCTVHSGNPCLSCTTCDELTDVCLPISCMPPAPGACNDNNVCTTDSYDANVCAAVCPCVYTPVPDGTSCNDGLFCTKTDVCFGGICTGSGNPCPTGESCNEAADACIITTTGNNFTLNLPLDYGGGAMGGTNDVVFTWDGSVHATLTGVSNAAISSNEPFQGWLWYAHDVEIVGPGTHSVDLCAKGPGSCAVISANPGTFFYEVTVPTGMLGTHLLFDWGQSNPFPPTYCCKAACDIDMWVVWDANKAFAGNLYTGADNGVVGGSTPMDKYDLCHVVPVSVLDGMPNTSATIWSLVSVDAVGRITDATGTTLVNYPLDGIPGLPMADGAFPNFSANFNVMTVVDTGCMINGMVIASGATNPANQCQACIPAVNTTAWSNKPNGTSCDDALFCNGTDTCSSGTCIHSGNPCPTGTICNESTDHCDTVDCTGRPAGTACNDSNPCTTNDVCVKSGNKMVCKGTNVANGTGCNDGNLCTTGDYCSSGVCKAGVAKNCNDGRVCTTDTCNPATGECVNTPIAGCCMNDAMCNDNNPCTIDTCDTSTGKCGNVAKVCDDNNKCTKDSCDPTTGNCVFTPRPKSAVVLGSNENETASINGQIATQFAVQNDGCIMSTSMSQVKVSPGSVVTFDCHFGTGPDPVNGTLDGVKITQPGGTFTCPDTTVTHLLYLDNITKKGPGKDKDNYQIRGSDTE